MCVEVVQSGALHRLFNPLEEIRTKFLPGLQLPRVEVGLLEVESGSVGRHGVGLHVTSEGSRDKDVFLSMHDIDGVQLEVRVVEVRAAPERERIDREGLTLSLSQSQEEMGSHSLERPGYPRLSLWRHPELFNNNPLDLRCD